MVIKNATNYYTVASTAHDTCGYNNHVLRYAAARYYEIEPRGYLYGAHDHVAQYYMRKQLPGNS